MAENFKIPSGLAICQCADFSYWPLKVLQQKISLAQKFKFNERTLASSTCGGVAGAGGHRGRLQDDSVATGGESNRHLLIQDPTWSLSDGGKGNHVTWNVFLNALIFGGFDVVR